MRLDYVGASIGSADQSKFQQTEMNNILGPLRGRDFNNNIVNVQRTMKSVYTLTRKIGILIFDVRTTRRAVVGRCSDGRIEFSF